jgi:arylsulfatase A-like enzyme
MITAPLHMVDIMPTALAMAGAAPNPASKPLDGKNLLPMLIEGKPSPHDDLLINVEAFRGAIIKGQ